MLDGIIILALMVLSGWLVWHMVWCFVDFIHISREDKDEL